MLLSGQVFKPSGHHVCLAAFKCLEQAVVTGWHGKLYTSSTNVLKPSGHHVWLAAFKCGQDGA